jgi:hypothetical protein
VRNFEDKVPPFTTHCTNGVKGNIGPAGSQISIIAPGRTQRMTKNTARALHEHYYHTPASLFKDAFSTTWVKKRNKKDVEGSDRKKTEII